MPIESKGKRDPALAAAIKANRLPETALCDYVVGRRPLKVGEDTRMPGDPIPEAAAWPRLDSWLHTGAIVAVPGGSAPVQAPKPAQRPAQPRAEAPEEPSRPALRPRKGVNA